MKRARYTAITQPALFVRSKPDREWYGDFSLVVGLRDGRCGGDLP